MKSKYLGLVIAGLFLIMIFVGLNKKSSNEQILPQMYQPLPPPPQQPINYKDSLEREYQELANEIQRKDAKGIKHINPNIDISPGPVPPNYLPHRYSYIRRDYINHSLRPTGHPTVFNPPGARPYYPGGYSYWR